MICVHTCSPCDICTGKHCNRGLWCRFWWMVVVLLCSWWGVSRQLWKGDELAVFSSLLCFQGKTLIGYACVTKRLFELKFVIYFSLILQEIETEVAETFKSEMEDNQMSVANRIKSQVLFLNFLKFHSCTCASLFIWGIETIVEAITFEGFVYTMSTWCAFVEAITARLWTSWKQKLSFC